MEYREIKIDDKEYPEKLRRIKNAPFKLCTMGDVSILNKDCISVVGTRYITDYGKMHGREICKELALRNIPIVSGLANGSDTLAHKTALEFGGDTIAVLPCGLENIYPKQNRKLVEEIIESGGLIVTEYDKDIKADSEKFLERNRIVAGLGEGLFVIEALRRSGTSVTARFAKEQGKQVFALPGSLDNIYSVGTNNLIKNGAKLVTNVVDILENYPQLLNQERKNDNVPKVKEEYKNLFLAIFPDKYLSLDEITIKTGMTTREVITKLTLMELEGIVEQEIGKGYKRKV
jgi:DNA processing protein